MLQPSSHYTVLDHVAEMRTRIILCCVMIGVCALAGFAGYEVLCQWLFRPARGSIDQLYVFSPETALVVRIKMALIVGVLCAVPCLLYQIAAFVKPGLHAAERRILFAGGIAGVVLYAAGMAFSYYGLLPHAIRFLMAYSYGVARPMIALDAYMRFSVALLSAGGFIFISPIVCIVLDRAHIISHTQLAQHRGSVLIVIVALAALVTPPDVVTQCLLAVPLYVLFEITLLCMKGFAVNRER